MEKEYILKLSEKQASTMLKALDLYSRIGIGQLQEVVNIYRWSGRIPETADVDAIDKHMAEVKRLITGFPPNASHGIFNQNDVPVEYRRAFDILQVLRQRVAKERGIGDWSVDIQAPMPATDEALPTCDVKEK